VAEVEEVWPLEGLCAPAKGRLRLAVEVELKPRILLPRRRVGRERALAKAVAHPSLFPSLARLAFALAERGYRARVSLVRVGDLAPAELLPPFLLKPLAWRSARAVLEVYGR